MLTLQEAQQIINREISKRKIFSQPQDLYEPINYILSLGGKRFRPALCLMACNLYSDIYQSAIGAALALEIFHNFTLLHDDIMDNANTRRGKPTVHAKWNNNVAILSGDAMCIKAYECIEDTDANSLKKVFGLFNRTAIKVCEGQQYDMEFESLDDVTMDEYIKMIELKTSVLIASCLKIGAVIGGASDADAELLYDFGLNIGIAFQLQDDLLDVFGDEKLFGKEIGKDIISNKKTFLLIKALELAKEEDLEVLKKWISTKQFDAKSKVEAIKSIYNKLAIKELTINLIDNYLNNAQLSLANIVIDEDKKIEMKNFLKTMRNRKC